MISQINKLSAVLVILSCLFISSCTGDVVAMVNHEPISRAELISSLPLLENPTFADKKSVNQSLSIRDSLHTLIDEKLVDQAAKKAALDISDLDHDHIIEQYLGSYSKDSFKKMLDDKGINQTTWARRRQHYLLTERYVEHKILNSIIITDKEVKDYYKLHAKEYQQSDKVHVRHILTDEADTAAEIHGKLLKGENFAHLAMEYSIAPEAKSGGNLGWIERGNFPAVFEDNCFHLPVGAVSQVIRSEFGYHIFKVVERKRRGQSSFTEMKKIIREELQQKAVSENFQAHLEELREKATIEINEESLQRLIQWKKGV